MIPKKKKKSEKKFLADSVHKNFLFKCSLSPLFATIVYLGFLRFLVHNFSYVHSLIDLRINKQATPLSFVFEQHFFSQPANNVIINMNVSQSLDTN